MSARNLVRLAAVAASLGLAAACGGNGTQSSTRCGVGTTRVGNVCQLDPGANGGEASAAGAKGEGAKAAGGYSGEAAQAGEGGAVIVAGQAGANAAGEGLGGAGGRETCEPSSEVCGNGLDENCDGNVDEGCGCEVVAPGQPGSLRIVGGLTRLLADRARCLSYVVTATTPSDLLVIDAGAKRILHRLTLPGPARDADISEDGRVLAVAGESVLWTIDTRSWSLAETVELRFNLAAVEVSNDGMAYIAAFPIFSDWSDEWRTGIFAVKLQPGAVPSWLHQTEALDLELSRDEQQLAALGDVWLDALQRKAGKWQAAGSTSLYRGIPGCLYLSPRGDVYDGVQRFSDGTRLAAIYGTVLAQAESGAFDVGAEQLFDTRTRRALAPLPARAEAALILKDDQELWLYHAASGELSYTNVADLIADESLGVRERPAQPLAAYALSALLADSPRGRLYGLDVAHQVVLSIDADSGEPLEEITLEPGATDFALDDVGDALLVTHDRSPHLLRIDLDSWTFDRLHPFAWLGSRIESLSEGRFAISGGYGWNRTAVVNGKTGRVLEMIPVYQPESELASADGGRTLFVMNRDEPRSLYRFDVSSSVLQLAVSAEAPLGAGGWALATPNGAGLFLNGGFYSAADLTTKLYTPAQRFYQVTPNSQLATSFDSVYRVSDGVRLGALPYTSTVQALSADGRTLYVLADGQIHPVSLDDY